MKKQILTAISTHPIRAAFLLILPFLLGPATHQALAQRNTGKRIVAANTSQLPTTSSGPISVSALRIPPMPKAPQVVLYDQYNNGSGAATLSATFTDFPTFSADLADDFVVPAGQTWNVQSIDADGVYFNGPGPANSWNVFIYADNAGLPGMQIFSATNQPVTQVGTTFTVNLPAPAVLTAGTYWVEIQANMTDSTEGEWGWTDRTVQSNNPAAWQNPGGGFGVCPTWMPKLATCVPTAGGPDQVYRLNGTMGGGGTCTGYDFTSGAATFVPGVTDTGNHCDDCTTAITLPFPVTLYDQMFTTAMVGSNGALFFGTANATFDITCSPLGVAGTTYTMGPFWDDQVTFNAGEGIFTTTTGTAPNRVFYIEWRAEYFSTSQPVNYEIALYENGTPPFQYIYNSIPVKTSANDSQLVVGVKKDDTTGDFTQYGCDPTGGEAPPVSSGQALTATCMSGGISCTPCNAGYVTTTSTGAIVPGTVDTGNHCDDCATAITFPFPVSVYGQTTTTANVSSNGSLDLTGTQAPFTHGCQVLPSTSWSAAILPYQDDLRTDVGLSGCSAFSNGCGIFTSVSGTAPNRTLYVEWHAVHFADNTATADFEVVFYENSQTHFDIIYGATSDNGSDETSGVQASSTGPATTFSCAAATLTNGLDVTYSIATCPAPVPTDAVSRKTHGAAGTFDIELPRVDIHGAVGIEDRTQGAAGGVCPAWQMRTPFPPPTSYGGGATSDGTYAYVAGGYSFDTGAAVNIFQRYNPSTDTWTVLAPMADAEAETSAVYSPANNKVYVFGGDDPNTGIVSNATRIYDIGTNTWSAGANMPDVRAFMASGYYNGKIYLVGGYNTGNVDPSFGQVWEYDPVLDTFNTSRTSMPITMGGPGFGIINGHIYVAGGRNLNNTNLNTLYDYNIAADTWTQRANLPAGVNVPGSGVENGQLAVFGGGNPFAKDGQAAVRPNRRAGKSGAFSPETTGASVIYDPGTDTWATGPALNQQRSFPAGTNVGNTLVAAGGYTGVSTTGSTETTACTTGAFAHQMIVTFAVPVTVQSASVTTGTGSVSSFTVSSNVVTVNLTGVTNAQRLGVTLHNVCDGTNQGDVLIPMGVLSGDVNGNGTVSAADVAQTKAQVGATVGGSNFREDVNANGVLNAIDVAIVKSKTGTALPP